MLYASLMWMRLGLLGLLPLLCGAATGPAGWVPVRWPWNDARSLELLAGTPVNCLLLTRYTPEFVAAAQARGVSALAVVTSANEIEGALASKVDGIVLEGEFPEDVALGIKSVPVIVLGPRTRMPLGSGAAIVGTNQGVWPGISADDEGAKKSGPTSGVWIDTNTGFLRAVRSWGNPTVWIANLPPPKTVVTTTRYLQVIADAAASPARAG